jgi:hypothetical protein
MYITLVELPEYIRDADRLLDEENQAERNKLSKLVSILVKTYGAKK